MSRNRREHGRIISVETHTRGDALAEDAAAGATSITVEDAGDFDEDGGWLLIGAQVVEFTECDDDTGVITLADPLDAAAEQGDPVRVWSELYEEVIDYQIALVEVDGEYDNPDPVVAEVAEGVGELPEGDRGKAGESCTMHRVGEDEWEVVAVGGRGRQSQSIRFEQDDTYTLTAADITAGTATMSLSHRPKDEALTCYLAGVPQRPTEWTIDYDAQTLTIPLSGWEQAGDVLWVHYAYRKGIATRVIEDTTFEFYLPNAVQSPAVTPAHSPEWEFVNLSGNSTPDPQTSAVSLTRGTSGVSTSAAIWIANTSVGDALARQFVTSEQIASARTISGTFSAGVCLYNSSATPISGYLQVMIRVVSADGGTVRGYLFNGVEGGSDSMPGQSSLGAMRYLTDLPLTPVAAQAGDRISIEVGFRSIGTASAGRAVTFLFGEQDTSPPSRVANYVRLNTNAGLA